MSRSLFHVVLGLGFTVAAILPLSVPESTAGDNSRPIVPAAQAKPRKEKMKTLMRRKLAASQEVLEGLTTENFDLIIKGAKELRAVSTAAEFKVSDNTMYVQHNQEFQRIVDRMQKVAEQRKLDSAALSYVDLTMNCIECHRYVRDVLIAN